MNLDFQQTGAAVGHEDARARGANTASLEHPDPSADLRLPSQYYIKKERYSNNYIILSYLQDGRGKQLLDLGSAQGDLAQTAHSAGIRSNGY